MRFAIENLLAAFAPPSLLREPEMSKHFFLYLFDDPILRPLFVEVEVWDNDPAQEIAVVEAAFVSVVVALPQARIANDAVVELLRTSRHAYHCVGEEAFLAYRQQTGLRPEHWCTIRRGNDGRWLKIEGGM